MISPVPGEVVPSGFRSVTSLERSCWEGDTKMQENEKTGKSDNEDRRSRPTLLISEIARRLPKITSIFFDVKAFFSIMGVMMSCSSKGREQKGGKLSVRWCYRLV